MGRSGRTAVYDPQDQFGITNTIGLAELAARLGSLVKHDRRGQVAWYDDFESAVLKWYVSTGGGTATIVQSSVHTGNNSLELTANIGSSIRVKKSETFTGDSRTGFEVAFYIPSTFVDGFIDLVLRRFDGVSLKIAEIDYYPIAGTLDYYGGDGLHHTFATLPVYTGLPTWYTMKFAVDFSTSKYIRCIYQGVEHDLSLYDINTSANTEAKRTEFWLQVVGTGSQANTVYFDDVIFTVQEP